MNKKWLIVGGVVVLIAALGIFVSQRISGQTASSAAQATTETAVVKRGTLLVAVNATGSLVPQEEISLGFTASGRLKEVLVKEGQAVQASQPLARLDTDELQLQLAQAEASLAQVRAGARPEDIAVAEAALRSAKANYAKVATPVRPEEFAMAKADLEKAAAAVRRAQADYDRIGGASNPMIAMTQQALALEQATQEYQKAKAAFDLKVNGPRAEDLVTAQAQVDQAQAQLEKLKNTPRPEDVVVAQVQVDQTRLRLKYATLTAPIAGMITSVRFQAGEMVGAGQTVLVLMNLDALQVGINLDETDVTRIGVDAPATVTLDAFPDAQLAGRVKSIDAAATVQSGVVLYPVTLALSDGARVPLRPGMTANVTIAVEKRENVLLAPFRSIETKDGQAFVTRVKGSATERVPVTLGLITDTQIEILSGVSEGDLVAVYANPVQDSSLQMRTPFSGGK